MKNFLEICDLYGTQFHWYIWFKPKYYSYFGGIFSILSLFAFLAIFIIFGSDDFKRIHPISNISTTPPSGYKNIKFGKQKLYLPWRIIDYDENPINISGIIYPRIYYFTVHPDNITGQLITKYNLVNYKLCNDTSMKYLGKEYIIDIPLDTLYCIDMEELNMGGSWNSDFLNFIRFDLYMCKDGIDYNESNYKCTKYETLQNKYGGGESIFFELLYPVVHFQPTNLDTPILIVYKTLYYIFNKFSNKLDRMYLQEYIFEDEKGWVFNGKKNYSYWGVNNINGESYIIGEKDVLRFSSTSRLYTINIYFEFGNVYYTRKYKKIYEILGEVFPIISAVWSFFSFISRIINELQSTKKLNEFIQGYDNKHMNNIYKNNERKFKTNKKLKIFSNHFNSSFKNNYDININNNRNGINEDHSNKLYPHSNNFNDSSKIFCFSNNIINIQKGIHKFNNINISNNINQSTHNKKDINMQNKEKFPINFYFIGFLLNKMDINKRKNINCINKKFKRSFSLFRHLIDITSYIALYKQFELFKKIIIDNFQSSENDPLKINKKIENPNNQLLSQDNIYNINFSLNRSLKPIELKLK